jgi:hypothetical protein
MVVRASVPAVPAVFV